MSASAGRLRRDKSKNYNRKGTIERQMQRSIVGILLLFAGASSAAAQTKPATADAAGGAYYEFMMGLQLETQGDGPGAVAAYQRAEKLDSTSAEIPAALAELYARLNRPADAIAAGERAVKANPTNPEANWILGSLYARMSDMPSTRQADRRTYRERAIANLEKSSRNAHPSVPTMLGRLYIADEQYDKAMALLLPFINDEPDQVEAVAMLAEAYQATDRDADAIALLEKSVQGAPELFSTLGQVYQDAGRWHDAARAFAGAVEERPQSLPLRSQWATALLNLGDAQRARDVLEEGAAGNSRNQRALYLLSEAQRRTRDYAAAEVTARRLIALDARSLLGPRQLAQIFQDQNDHQKIIGLLEPIVTARLGAADAADLASETFRSTYFDLASAYERLRQFDKAITMLRQARTLSPTDPVVEIRLARSQQDAGKGDDAIKTLQAAVAKFPKEPAVKLSLASTLERERKFGDAEAIFRQMLADDPKNSDALNSLAYMLADRGQKLDEAVSLVQRALAIEPENGAYLDTLGWAYYKQNRLDQAEGPMKEAAEKLPTVSVIQDHLGDVLAKRGAFEEAITAWQKALDGDGDSISRSELEDKIRSARQRLDRKK
jgi:tetratricopeptide (TPR) repeat protein